MQFLFDRTGFPLICLPKIGLGVQLLPVTKIQFEQYLTEADIYGDMWYKAVLHENPRVSYRYFTPDNREGIFITGILTQEARKFSEWIGTGYRLLTVGEWRSIYLVLQNSCFEEEEFQQLLSCCDGAQARFILSELRAQLRPRCWLDLSLMQGGLVEWVGQADAWVGIGQPRSVFRHNLWDPLTEVLTFVDPKRRLQYVGFRLVREYGTT
jgi:hypothetical protein